MWSSIARDQIVIEPFRVGEWNAMMTVVDTFQGVWWSVCWHECSWRCDLVAQTKELLLITHQRWQTDNRVHTFHGWGDNIVMVMQCGGDIKWTGNPGIFSVPCHWRGSACNSLGTYMTLLLFMQTIMCPMWPSLPGSGSSISPSPGELCSADEEHSYGNGD